MYEVYFTKKSAKQLNKIARLDRRNLLAKFAKLNFPFPPNFDIDTISGVPGFYRLRTGDVRTIIEVDKKRKQIWIRKIKYRGSIYKL